MSCVSTILSFLMMLAIAAMIGKASYYRYGKTTASGEAFNPGRLTAAHRTLKFGTRVRVTHLKTGRSVEVRINDRGPFTQGRIIDLSLGAAQAIGLDKTGVATVKLTILGTKIPVYWAHSDKY
ncbi:MAG: septal ring lytic transglycosylase RlpA family protein [Hyphomicrobiales bacterium]